MKNEEEYSLWKSQESSPLHCPRKPRLLLIGQPCLFANVGDAWSSLLRFVNLSNTTQRSQPSYCTCNYYLLAQTLLRDLIMTNQFALQVSSTTRCLKRGAPSRELSLLRQSERVAISHGYWQGCMQTWPRRSYRFNKQWWWECFDAPQWSAQYHQSCTCARSYRKAFVWVSALSRRASLWP